MEGFSDSADADGIAEEGLFVFRIVSDEGGGELEVVVFFFSLDFTGMFSSSFVFKSETPSEEEFEIELGWMDFAG